MFHACRNETNRKEKHPKVPAHTLPEAKHCDASTRSRKLVMNRPIVGNLLALTASIWPSSVRTKEW
jgi:hypothetical protein